MSGLSRATLAWVSALLLLSLCAGCLSTGIGDTWYENQSVRMKISHSGDPADVTVQVTAYRISNLTQEKYAVISAPVTLTRGENTAVVPGELPPGTYKLYVYILSDGDRKAAVIRDILV
jgi:hypothetical protein